jgi:hypothetical protein
MPSRDMPSDAFRASRLCVSVEKAMTADDRGRRELLLHARFQQLSRPGMSIRPTMSRARDGDVQQRLKCVSTFAVTDSVGRRAWVSERGGYFLDWLRGVTTI